MSDLVLNCANREDDRCWVKGSKNIPVPCISAKGFKTCRQSSIFATARTESEVCRNYKAGRMSGQARDTCGHVLREDIRFLIPAKTLLSTTTKPPNQMIVGTQVRLWEGDPTKFSLSCASHRFADSMCFYSAQYGSKLFGTRPDPISRPLSMLGCITLWPDPCSTGITNRIAFGRENRTTTGMISILQSYLTTCVSFR
jgi:hypothetical protein